ncbi:MAG: MqnA/MqnD/SBP family protein, partial [Planctomycetota bacterium]
ADAGNRRILDLGEEWYAFKGLPFVFALWLIRAHGEREARLLRYLREAWPMAQARGVEDGTGGRIEYELGSNHMRGLEAFHAEATEMGLCPPGIEPRWTRVDARSGAS